MSIPIYLAFSPEEAPQALAAGRPLACLGYQLARESPALLAPDPLPDGEALLVLQDSVQPTYDPSPALAALIAQYAAAFHTGLVCDFDRPPSPFWETLVERLDGCCQREKLPLWVSEAYASRAPHAWVLIGSDLSGGSFSEYAAEAAARYPGRCVLELRPVSARFSLPCPTGAGAPLTVQARQDLLQASGAPVWESDDLLCSYFSIWTPPDLDIVLFDTPGSLRAKAAAAERAGFRAVVGLLQELTLAFPDGHEIQ